MRAATEGGDRGEGPGRGNAVNIDPRFPGAESWAAGANSHGEQRPRVSEELPYVGPLLDAKLAAEFAGLTVVKISVPRFSVWSKRSKSKTLSSCQSAPKVVLSSKIHQQ